MIQQAVAADQWTARRRRAAELAERWPFAAQVLGFYAALLDVQAAIYGAARDTFGPGIRPTFGPTAGGQSDSAGSLPGSSAPDPSLIIACIAERAVPPVRDVTIARGPEKLAGALRTDVSTDEWQARARAWLAGDTLPAADQYLVRAAAGPVLEALGPAVAALQTGPRDERHCPQCGGLPQVGVFMPSGEDLVAPRRYLECSRCASRWSFPRLVCAACGEQEAKQLPVFAEEGTTEVEATGSVIRGGAAAAAPRGAGAARFPHVSIHACRTCSRYLLNVDLARDSRAVPAVDEIAAIPLDLYAREQGLTKVIPNLMGF